MTRKHLLIVAFVLLFCGAMIACALPKPLAETARSAARSPEHRKMLEEVMWRSFLTGTWEVSEGKTKLYLLTTQMPPDEIKRRVTPQTLDANLYRFDETTFSYLTPSGQTITSGTYRLPEIDGDVARIEVGKTRDILVRLDESSFAERVGDLWIVRQRVY